MNHCYFCSGELEEQLTTFGNYQATPSQPPPTSGRVREGLVVTTFVYAEDDIVWIIRQAPTYVCRQCGEKEYSQETTHHILSLLQHPPRPTEILHVPAYDWSGQLPPSSVKSSAVLAERER